jgi:hypothetical protein
MQLNYLANFTSYETTLRLHQLAYSICLRAHRGHYSSKFDVGRHFQDNPSIHSVIIISRDSSGEHAYIVAALTYF